MDEQHDLSDMTFERFTMWTVNSLKSYLHVRHKSIEGSFDDLAARYLHLKTITTYTALKMYYCSGTFIAYLLLIINALKIQKYFMN